jgi:glycine/D-amino acid oxidase-like deaminating enzyme
VREQFEVIVVGGGVIGASVAFHVSALGASSVLLIERGSIGSGTSAQSSGILRTHYSVRENVELAQRAWQFFVDFQAQLGDDEAACGLVKCGYLIAARDDAMREALRQSLAQQQAQGVRVDYLDAGEAAKLLPIARFDDAALIGFEPDAGFADAYLVATSFVRAARRRGVKVVEGLAVIGLLVEGRGDARRVTGVLTANGPIRGGTVVSTQNIWAAELGRWLGTPMHVRAERHAVLALQCEPAPYTQAMPVFKDLSSPGMLYCRSYGGRQMLVSEGTAGVALDEPSCEQADVPLDYVAAVGEQVAARFPAYAAAGLASSWTGVYDVTPDWNPVLGRLPGVDGLVVGYGFSGHGFKLSPIVGKVLAQEALGLPTDVPLAPYSAQRFATGALLEGRYGAGAVS